MGKRKKEYRRLPGRGIRKGGFLSVTATRCSLWLGDDHLLCLDNETFRENYKRFYYRDIQAITTRKINRWKDRNMLTWAGGLAGGMVGVSLTVGGNEILWSIAAILALILFISWIRKPTCVCHLYTSVHTEELPSLKRLRTVRKAMSLLKPLIERAQGEMTLEELQAKTAQIFQEAHAQDSSRTASERSSRATSPYRGTAHAILFSLLLLDGFLSWIAILYNHVGITLFGIIVGAGLFVSVIAAIVRQHDANVPTGLRRLTFTTLGYLCVVLFLDYGQYMMIAITDPATYANQWELIKSYSALSPLESPFVLGVHLFTIVCSFAIAVPGFVLLRKYSLALTG
jgi:hypothetical protein